VGHHAQTVRDGRWSASPDFCYWDYPLIELEGLTMGIVGFGRIGQAVAALAETFGMKVLAHTRTLPKQASGGAQFVDLESLFRQSDVISLHCPLTAETKLLVNPKRLASMKPAAFILNTSRGPLIDEAALAQALNESQIAGAGLDVLAIEPPLATNPLLRARNCYVTPHIAWATKAARARLLQTAIDNVEAFLRGKPQNVVN
jgi:glycerate dehydrogenase